MSNLPSVSSPLALPPHTRSDSGNVIAPPPPPPPPPPHQQLYPQPPSSSSSSSNNGSRPTTSSGPSNNNNNSNAIRSAGPRSLLPPRISPSAPIREQSPQSPVTPKFFAGLTMDSQSSERLLPRPKSRPYRLRDADSLPGSPTSKSGLSSRRTSWSSADGGGARDSRYFVPNNPFDDLRTASRAGSDADDTVNLNTQTVSDKYNITPAPGLLLFPEDVEKDDYLHNPDPNEKERRECDIFSKRGLVNIGGLVLITIGVLALFIGYPVLTWFRKLELKNDPCRGVSNCLNVGTIPLLKNTRTGLIDPDTPKEAMTKMSADGSTELNLVFSDEFNKPGRTFYPGDDPYFTAVDLWYGVTGDLEWYDPDAITTNDGVLEIRFDAFQNHGLNYRSGMLQSWNQMCFTGGRMEASISLPGRGDTIGFWPGFWAMGNLGRPGYASSTEGMWPYSYDDICDAGITPNQSSTDGISYLPGMRLPACTCQGEDHPSPGKSRSAPEIDALEASVAHLDPKNMVGQVSQSCQLAPFDIWYYPDYEYCELYDDTITNMNSYTGGPFQEAASGLTMLNNDWYDGKAYQVYAFEYNPGSQGDITWFVGQDKTWKLDARAIRPNGNVGQRIIPAEPMAVVLNFGMSSSFAGLNFTGIGETLPATMRVDYIRIYQDPNDDSQSVTCDPPGYPTTDYIASHPEAYANLNKTKWSQLDYDWPKNALMNDCQAEDSSVPIQRS